MNILELDELSDMALSADLGFPIEKIEEIRKWAATERAGRCSFCDDGCGPVGEKRCEAARIAGNDECSDGIFWSISTLGFTVRKCHS